MLFFLNKKKRVQLCFLHGDEIYGLWLSDPNSSEATQKQ